jgi:hypothetical protein
MKVTLHAWDVQTLIENYIAKQLEANPERVDITEMYFEYEQTTYNEETQQWITSEPTSYPFDENCELQVYIDEVNKP